MCPFTYLESGDARNSAPRAMSSGSANLPCGIFLSNPSRAIEGLLAKSIVAVHCGVKEVREIKRVIVYDISRNASERFAHEMSSSLGVEVRIANSINDLKVCDIISCATPSKEPLITENLLHEGLHINSVGMGAGLGKREVDFKILRKTKVVVDDKEVAESESLSEAFKEGLITTREIYASLGDLVLGKLKGREKDETTIFISAGMAIQDVAVAKLAYDRAAEKGVGRKFNFFE